MPFKKGNKFSKEIEAIRLANLRKASEKRHGKKLPEWWKQKLRKPKSHTENMGRKKGCIPAIKGKHHSDETKLKISQKKKGKHSSYKTEFTSERVKQMFSDKNFKERHKMKTLLALRRRPTSLEKKFMKIIQKNNLPFVYCGDGSLLIGWKNPDFYETNGKKICVEVANKFHHQGDWAKKRIEHFAKYGWKCLVFFGDKHNNFELSEVEICQKLKS